MHIIGILISAVVMLLVYVAQAKENKRLSDAHGGEPLTRNQRAYIRRKARQQGVEPTAVSYRPRKH